MYSNQQAEIIDDHLSYLHPQRVFCGQYWDEFALTAHLVPDRAHVLMLGLASGGGIRPILASTKNIELTCVDLDPVSVQTCRSLFASQFPALRFEVVAAEALSYLNSTSKKYDVIWIDLFAPQAYADICLRSEFYRSVRSALKPDGIVMMNAYGVPNVRFPRVPDGVQSIVAGLLAENFRHLSALPYRRNLTFIASHQHPRLKSAQPTDILKEIDAKAFLAASLRLKDLDSESSAMDTTGAADFDSINRAMGQQWRDLATDLIAAGLPLEHPAQLVDVMEGQFVDNLDPLLEKDVSLLNFLPILAAGESQVREVPADWLFHWFGERALRLRELSPTIYRQIWLTQLWSMVLQPKGHFAKHSLSIWPLIEREFL